MAPAALFTIDRVELNGEAVFRLRGELDLSTHHDMAAALDDALSRTEGQVVLDIEHLRFVDAHTLGMWERAALQLRDRGTELVLRNPSAIVRRMIDVLGLDRVLRVE